MPVPGMIPVRPVVPVTAGKYGHTVSRLWCFCIIFLRISMYYAHQSPGDIHMTRLPCHVRRGFVLWVVWIFLCSTPLLVTANNDTLPIDPAMRIGTLPNGVTYWVRSHATPPGKITLWMHVATGSLNE